MSLRSKIILGFLLGSFGGLAGWVLTEMVPGLNARPSSPSQLYVKDAIFGALAGLAIGAALGAVEGITVRTPAIIARGGFVGGCVGIVAGVLGLWTGESAFQSLIGGPPQSADVFPSFSHFAWRVAARAVGWGVIGLCIGLSEGMPHFSMRKMRHGMAGGFIGGFIGGAAFDIVALNFHTDILSRLIGLTLIGALIGFFIGLVEDLLKQAWVKVLSGRNEGKEYIISKDIVTVGRDELCDIGLFGDRSIALQHAAIRKESSGYVLYDEGKAPGTIVNGVAVKKHSLQDGDAIQIGRMRLLFREKAVSRPERAPVDVTPPPAQARRPMPSGLCPYCGQAKDSLNGSCACAPGPGSPLASGPSPSQGTGDIVRPPGEGPWLVGLDGLYKEHFFAIEGSPVHIGREMGLGVALLGDTTASRRHARLVLEGDHYVIYDEGSMNGIYVNDERVTRAAIRPGDRIRIGGTTFRFVM
ncbi:MAG: FHA domain-containing protein [Armatimonadetes bacterium]|nr:FHA domain-containing protein [Armatimonadota bacterium]